MRYKSGRDELLLKDLRMRGTNWAEGADLGTTRRLKMTYFRAPTSEVSRTRLSSPCLLLNEIIVVFALD